MPPSSQSLLAEKTSTTSSTRHRPGTCTSVRSSCYAAFRGTPTGKVSISSAHFHDYWAAFVMIYGINLLTDTLTLSAAEMVETTTSPLRTGAYRDALQTLENIGFVPLAWGWEFTEFAELTAKIAAQRR